MQDLVSGCIMERQIALVVFDENVGSEVAKLFHGLKVGEHGGDVHRRKRIPIAHVHLDRMMVGRGVTAVTNMFTINCVLCIYTHDSLNG